jgi:hypothetical protein
MPKYFCVAYDDRDFVAKVKDESAYYSGYQEAGNWDLALTAFMANLGLDRNHPNIRSFVPDVDTIRMDRLAETMWESVQDSPWDCGFSLEMVTPEVDSSLGSEYFHFTPGWRERDTRTLSYHVSRVRWFMENPERITPIGVDNRCDGGMIYAIPVITDGWHRYIAAHLLGLSTIEVFYSGRMDLLAYLKGETDINPEEYCEEDMKEDLEVKNASC